MGGGVEVQYRVIKCENSWGQIDDFLTLVCEYYDVTFKIRL